MIIGTLKEKHEPRVAIVPQLVKKFLTLAMEDVAVMVEDGMSDLYENSAYETAGAKVTSRENVLKSSDILCLLNPLSVEDLALVKKGAMIISHMDPYNNKAYIDALASKGLSSISMEMIPRSTIAQKMDSLSSQASLAGYVAVMKGATLMNKIFPMMMTPSGTIAPAKVFIIGVGVAGLQAIATAKRLGAKVEAFDTRPVVEEQVQSLGAKFVKVDLGEMGETADGYAKELTKEQLLLQQKAMEKACINADLVITTAKLFGKKAPVIVTDSIVSKMKPGSVIVDLAAGTGGNVEGTVVDEIVTSHGVKIVGIDNLAGLVPLDASQMYSNNIINLLGHFCNKETKTIDFTTDEIARACVITYGGEITNERIRSFYNK